MTIIELQTSINAPLEEVFDLARSIDFHMESASRTKERAIAGRKEGLINYGETVTWRGKHFGLYLKHTSKITVFQRPINFTDVMIEGHFSYFTHQHIFKSTDRGITMIDILKYKVPYGWIGRLFDKLLLEKHLRKFLNTRNIAIKTRAEVNCF